MSFSVFDALTENFEKIFKTMKERDDKRSKLHEVEKEITLVCFLQKYLNILADFLIWKVLQNICMCWPFDNL
jgi:hypothetical protein